ncbi:helix-turn-helix domain containing protein [Micromonospora sp. WMMD1076]|uniref:TetR/AcrR family transcriptional regulator n=1 Tax=Micromonospora TaxID=1873 RepID=UPI00249B4518|nr:TetR/AcrR family transcriptional regulator [Micromonospora sp. WMMD1076]WFF05867.1 helix-turn-helix domain containing protein [Micromonospora sp. WMMD1076]
MPLSLRQRNRMAAIRAIQDTAMELFDSRGFHNVTIDDIAREAAVSPSTFYRYFGSKEGLFTVDPFAAVGADGFDEVLDLDDLPGTMTRLAASAGGGGPWRGMRYVLEEPTIRAAVYATMDAMVDRLAAALADRGHGPTAARVLARTYTFGVYFSALEQWHDDGRTRPVGEYVREALEAIPTEHRASGPGAGDAHT